ncbi:MAG: transporter substrate-binding domain-containing protein [Alphaproteobacteria bacterium]|nr:MAG: transporter substrate-binding domain-containing protein [Alphaproteobacteria bacterium]
MLLGMTMCTSVLKTILALGLALFAEVAGAVEAEVTVYTENFAPYNYEAEDGTVLGLSTDNVRLVLDEAGLAYEIKVLPWTRALRQARSDDHALIYTMARTPARDPDFDWLVPLFRSEFYLFARADDPRAVTRDALAQGSFTAACVVADVACELFEWLGVPAENVTVMPNQGALDFQLVLAGRADLYLRDKAANIEQLKLAGENAAVIRQAMRVGYDGGFFLAAGHHVDAAVRARVRAAYERLLAEGRYHVLGDGGDGR